MPARSPRTPTRSRSRRSWSSAPCSISRLRLDRGRVNRRDFLKLRRGRERVLELSCESLHMRWVDAIGRRARISSEDPAPWESGEPPLRVSAETEEELLAELDRSLAAADVLRVSDAEWLRDSPLEREVASRIEAFRKKGGRILLALVAGAFFAAPAA